MHDIEEMMDYLLEQKRIREVYLVKRREATKKGFVWQANASPLHVSFGHTAVGALKGLMNRFPKPVGK